MACSVARRQTAPYPGAMPRLRLAAAQLDLVVGDLAGNSARILEAYEQADAAGCDLIAFPELAITGYPPEDLLLKPAFVAQAAESRSRRSRRAPAGSRRSSASPKPAATSSTRPRCARTARCRASTASTCCPNYAVFDEQRYFAPSTVDGPLFVVGGVRVGVTICEDAWSPTGPIITQAAGGAELIVNVNASPYYAGRLRERETMLATRAADAQVPVVVREPRRRPGRAGLRRRVDGVRRERRARSPAATQFVEDLLVVDLDVRPGFRRRLLDPRGRVTAPPLPETAVSDAQIGAPHEPARDRAAARAGARGLRGAVLGTRDYVTQERLRAGAHRVVRWHRLVARRRDRRRRARCRPGHRRAHAVAVLERPQHHGRRGPRREPRASRP